MNIVLIQQTAPQQRKRTQEREEALLALVEQEADARKRGHLQALMGLLLVPESALAALPPSACFALVKASFELMDERKEDIALVRWSPDDGHCRLLLINMPDAPYAATSLRLLNPAYDGMSRLMAYLSLRVQRDSTGILSLGAAGPDDAKEAVIVIRLESAEDTGLGLRETLTAALTVCRDSRALAARLESLAHIAIPPSWAELSDWLRGGAFLPFAYSLWMIPPQGEKQECAEERLGIAPPEDAACGLGPVAGRGETPPSLEPACLLRQTRLQSPLCRFEPLTQWVCREYLPDGAIREHEFLGLLSSSALEEPVFRVPALRNKIAHALHGLSILPGSDDYQRVADLFNAFPKVELLFTGVEQLDLITRSQLRFQRRRGLLKLLLLASPDPAVFVLLALQPNSLFQEKNVKALENWLLAQVQASLACTRIIHSGAEYVGLCWTFAPTADEVRLDIEHLEKGLNRLSQFWERRFRRLLQRVAGTQGLALADPYGAAFPPGFRELTPPVLAVRDTLQMERVIESGADALELWKPDRDPCAPCHLLRLYSLHGRYLDELLPMLENIGLRVADHMQFSLNVRGRTLFITSFSVQPAKPLALPLMALKKTLLETLLDLLAGRVEDDAMNGLLLLTGLAWREIDVFRGYRNYCLQLSTRTTQQRFHQALLNNPAIVVLLYRYFEARFNQDRLEPQPQGHGEDTLTAVQMEIATALDRVEELAEDRILRDLFNLIDATVRTNYFLRRGCQDYFFAFKVSSLGVLNMPSPCPLFEIYVHAIGMEGIHLRGAKVARGGIRWSDRPDDFRSEILDLMQTQTIKNAQIVPHGAKGGFIVKTPYGNRPEALSLVNQAYTTLIRGLLDLTDNLGENGCVSPPGVVTYDGNDPYLVVAADKGTAHLSDTANAISKEYGFWLGDAFASGGSHGYDHKKLGITARGAWECVKRHFREIGHDIETQAFSVVGIGSMDGDVFGNGMLLSDSIRLRAAFGAKHIFLDPEPDGEIAYRERKRLFDQAGSSWDDYDRTLISPGGGVFERTAKDIPLAPAVRQWLGFRHRSIDGEGLIRLLLTAPVDLLWLGGIGTYVKSSEEANEAVGDRANAAVRVDAGQLQAKVVGEGANLGFTQKGRIEFALAGGRINIDAIDNSGGVDLSDHEVNLKILMAVLARKGIVGGKDERDVWLEAMTAEVCGKVLANNQRQSLCLSLDRERCLRDVEPFLAIAARLENAGLLDRASEAFPLRKEVLARSDRGLTRPELAVVMLHGKLALKRSLLDSEGFLSLPFLSPWLEGYFPDALRERYAANLGEHSLAREITATMLTNTVINQAGCGFLALTEDLDPVALINAVSAYLNYDEIIDARSIRARVHDLESSLPTERQHQYLLKLEDVLADHCRWALEHGQPTLLEASAIPAYRQLFHEYLDFLTESLCLAERATFAQVTAGLEREGFAGQALRLLAWADRLGDFPLLADLAVQTKMPLKQAAQSYKAVAEFLSFGQIGPLLDRLTVRDQWERRVQTLLRGRFRYNLARLTRTLLESGQGDPEALFSHCNSRRRLERLQRLHRDMREAAASTLPYSALSAELDSLVECSVAASIHP
jgi:glutamate dehydrogenase